MDDMELFKKLAQCEDKEQMQRVIDKHKERQKPQTNADRIRAMSDEELCEFLSQYKFCDICEEGCDACTYNGDCDKRLLEWLKQPAEGE